MQTIYTCILTSKALHAADFDLIVRACRIQLVDDFAPAWERKAPAVVTWQVGKPLPGESKDFRYVAARFRDLQPDDPEDALAYHWVTPQGRAEVVVLCDRILGQSGALRDDVCTGAGHEFIETEGNGWVSEWSDRGDGTEEAAELVDRVEGSSYPKVVPMDNGRVGHIRCTNFLLPNAFNNSPPPGVKYDFCGHLKHPRDIEPGGYAVIRKIGSGETELFGDRRIARAFSHKTLERHGIK